MIKSKSELEFENEFIEKLTTGTISLPEDQSGRVIKTRLWKYEPSIKTTEQLWQNFKSILEQHNSKSLDGPLSPAEFAQVKKQITDLNTPFQAGQFLYGMNGVSQIEVDMDDGRHVYLTVFDQSQIGAGDTVYQVVNQIQKPAILPGKPNRRFDVTLLINGLPIIQIELKKDTHDANEALNQMHQYITEAQYGDIFSTLQILVGMTPHNTKYMANTTADRFNKEFSFHWQRKNDSTIVRNWEEFTDTVLSIPAAHNLATNYMILDGTPNKEMLKVMRPYQVYATENAIQAIKNRDPDLLLNKLGFIWHTTGSGKTITSFKTAWQASNLPTVDKVVFVVDRKNLTRQTLENYRAYDPEYSNGDQDFSSIADTANTRELIKNLKSNSNDIVITSVQKLQRLVRKKNFTAPDKRILFIVDEAHRSTGGEVFREIQKKFKRSSWLGYTGTPLFDDSKGKLKTADIFGKCIHDYTIRNAIADHNVLGFNVVFKTTIEEETVRNKYLPDFYRQQNPDWNEEQIEEKINNITEDDIDDNLNASFYDNNPAHVKAVVADIFKNWRNRSVDGKYNAILTTHVGGNRPSIPMAMMYYDEFQRVNEENRKFGKPTLKVTVSFSMDSTNGENKLKTNQALSRVIDHYNKEFGTSFGLDSVEEYKNDVEDRLKKINREGEPLDLLIVVDQFLTGTDAPELNTLYVDRTLKGASLVQAYSRTNRIHDKFDKPFGHIINYRWPKQNEKLMNEALAIYTDSSFKNLTPSEQEEANVGNKVIAKKFDDVVRDVQEIVGEMRELTANFNHLPYSENEKYRFADLLTDYNKGIAMLKQYPEDSESKYGGYNSDFPEQLIAALGMNLDEQEQLETVLTHEIKEFIGKKTGIPVSDLDLRVIHIKDVIVNYDYLTEQLENLLNQIHENEMENAKTTETNIRKFANSLDDRRYARSIHSTADAIVSRQFPRVGSKFHYPYKLKSSEEVIKHAEQTVRENIFEKFIQEWGLQDIISAASLNRMTANHVFGEQDLDEANRLTNLLREGQQQYKEKAVSDKVRALTRIKYRNELRRSLTDLADKMVSE